MMENQPLVSIITPCYNGEAFIDSYFESILNQTYDNIELILINDGSEDHTDDLVRKYKGRIKDRGYSFVYIVQNNQGQAAAVNQGLKLFSGDYLSWPDSDDLMTDNCIEEKVSFLENYPEYGVCICKTAVAKEQDPSQIISVMERKTPNGRDTFFEDLIFIRNVYFSPGGYMVRTKALLDVIPDRNIYSGRGGQNAQILLPVLYKYSCGYIDKILNTYIVRKDSHSHQINTSEKEIEQNRLYQTILLETIKRIGEDVYTQYEKQIRNHYGRIIYGNAIDSGNKKLIREAYSCLKSISAVSIKDRLLYVKHGIF